MLFGCYYFHTEFLSKAVLPPYKGSTIRGAFGVALRRVLCVLKHQECNDCPLNGTCVYAQVFENLHEAAPATGKGAPHPFVIEPPPDEKTDYEPGDGMGFQLLLFGSSNEKLNYFVYAFEQMGRLGLGRSVGGKRGVFELKSVLVGSTNVFDLGDGTLTPPEPQTLSLDSLQVNTADVSRLTVKLITPLRLKFQNSFRDDLPFHVLIRAALRRISSLNSHFADGEPDLDYRGLVQRAGDVRIESSNLRWLDWARYSNRQETRMQMGGLIGQVTYTGALAEFVPLLRYCERVHIGKATTFGLGKISLDWDL